MKLFYNYFYDEKKIYWGRSITAFIFGLILLAMFLSLSNYNNINTNLRQPITSQDVYYKAREFVRGRLKAPSTAEFPWSDEAQITLTNPNEWSVQCYVDAQNSFGAKLRNYYIADLKFIDSSNTWIATKIKFIER